MIIRKAIYLTDTKVHGANMGPTWGRQDPWILLSGLLTLTPISDRYIVYIIAVQLPLKYNTLIALVAC